MVYIVIYYRARSSLVYSVKVVEGRYFCCCYNSSLRLLHLFTLYSLGKQKVEKAEKDHSKQRVRTPAKNAERPKSLHYQSLSVEPAVIRESPEFTLERGNADFTLSLDSGSRRAHQLPGSTRSPNPRGAQQSTQVSNCKTSWWRQTNSFQVTFTSEYLFFS